MRVEPQIGKPLDLGVDLTIVLGYQIPLRTPDANPFALVR